MITKFVRSNLDLNTFVDLTFYRVYPNCNSRFMNFYSSYDLDKKIF